MAQIRVGDRVAPIMAMHLEGRVLSMEVRQHKTMLVGGPLSGTTYVTVEHAPGIPTAVYRIGDLVRLDD
jgi:hypothetical protein